MCPIFAGPQGILNLVKENYCYVYLLSTVETHSFYTYVGWTNDLAKRLDKHNQGKGARFTRGRQWEIIYAERYLSKSDAMKREWELKNDKKFRQQFRIIKT